jgi:crossover junction endodeoxyribonuclease RuvC
MRILGIDPGLNITGYGLIETQTDKEFVLIEAGVIKTSRKSPLPKRLYYIYSEVLRLINEYRPQALVLEKTFSHYKYPTAVIPISYIRGLICLLCGQKNITLYNYSATRIKKTLTGKGHASKAQVQRMIFNFLNIKSSLKYVDATDALALAIGHCRMHSSTCVEDCLRLASRK